MHSAWYRSDNEDARPASSTSQTASVRPLDGGMEGGTGGQMDPVAQVYLERQLENVQMISRQLEDLKTKVLTAVQDQLQNFEMERSTQLESHCDAMRQMLQEHTNEFWSAAHSSGKHIAMKDNVSDGSGQLTGLLLESQATQLCESDSNPLISPTASVHSDDAAIYPELVQDSGSPSAACKRSPQAIDDDVASKEPLEREAPKASSSSSQDPPTKVEPTWSVNDQDWDESLVLDDVASEPRAQLHTPPPAPGAYSDPVPPTASGLHSLFGHTRVPITGNPPGIPQGPEETSTFCPVLPCAMGDDHDDEPLDVDKPESTMDIAMRNLAKTSTCSIELGPTEEKSTEAKPGFRRGDSQHSLANRSKIRSQSEHSKHDRDEPSCGMTLWKRTQTIQHREQTQEFERKQTDLPDEQPSATKKQLQTRKTMRRGSQDVIEEESIVERVVRTVVHSKQFGSVILGAILTNSIFIGAQTEVLIKHQISCYGHDRCEKSFWEYKVGEIIFAVFFTLELILRFLDYGPTPWITKMEGRVWHFFRGADWTWNCFDLLLVCTSAIDFFFYVTSIDSDALSFIKMLRVIRLMRVARVIRALRFFRSLRLMLHSIMNSITDVLWVCVLLTIMMFVVAIYIEQTVIEHFESSSPTDADEFRQVQNVFIIENFGGLWVSIISLFMSISGGRDWQELYQPLEKINWISGCVFLIYIFFVVFGVLNVVTGAFVDSMRLVSQKDNDLVIEQELKKETDFKNEITSIFEEADADGSNTLCWDEFEEHLQNERVRAYFTSLELDISEARALFVLLDVEENDEVPVEKFLSGCLRMRGDAKSIDVNMILYENEKMLCKLTTFTDYAEEVFEELKIGLADVRGRIGNIEKGTTGEEANQTGRSRARPRSGGPSTANGLPGLPQGGLDPTMVAQLQKRGQSPTPSGQEPGAEVTKNRKSVGPNNRRSVGPQSKGPPASRLDSAMVNFDRRQSNASDDDVDVLSSASVPSRRVSESAGRAAGANSRLASALNSIEAASDVNNDHAGRNSSVTPSRPSPGRRSMS